MTPIEETRGVIVKSLYDQVQKMNCEGGEFSKLAAQRIKFMEEAFVEIKRELKEGFASVGTQMSALDLKVSRALDEMENRSVLRYATINKVIIGILLLMVVLSFLAGINVWEMGKQAIGIIK